MTWAAFSFWFMLIHTAAYMLAGALALATFSKDVYEGRGRILDYQRDTSVEEERAHISRWLFPAQFLRGLLMSVVLYPVLAGLGELSFLSRFGFFAGLAFVFTHIACASPCSDNIEGAVYMKPGYFDRTAFWKFQLEMMIYSVLLAAAAAQFLF